MAATSDKVKHAATRLNCTPGVAFVSGAENAHQAAPTNTRDDHQPDSHACVSKRAWPTTSSRDTATSNPREKTKISRTCSGAGDRSLVRGGKKKPARKPSINQFLRGKNVALWAVCLSV